MLDIAIIGAGPYGLSVAAYMKSLGTSFRIFGRPMDSWLAHMPKGMMLKSDGFASNIYDPNGAFTLERFCADRGIEYGPVGNPVHLDTFANYGLAFKDRMVPELEDKMVERLDPLADGFSLGLDTGEMVLARRVVLAVGITHFAYVPPALAAMPLELVSHSYLHHDLEKFRGRSVVVVGGGSSALDMAALLHEAGANVQIVARRQALKFHSKGQDQRPLWDRIRHPQSGLGPGLQSRFYSNMPGIFHYLPEDLRLRIVRRHLGPAGGWFIKEKIVGRVPSQLGCTVESAEVRNGQVCLQLRAADGSKREILADHVIAATGYRVDINRLGFVSNEIRSKLKAVESTPVLSSNFESSIPGLFFVGVAAANSFGPLMRFAYGAGFAAQRVTRAMSGVATHDHVPVPEAEHEVVTIGK